MVKYFVLSLMLSLLLLSCTASTINPGKDRCSSTCGPLQNIYPPFRLKGDPGDCGDPNYEFICEGNNTILNYISGQYYVKEIFLHSNEIQVVDISLAGGNCQLPRHSLSPRAATKVGNYELTPFSWVSFVNCSSIIRDISYTLIPCLSQNGAFVYVTFRETVQYLKPSCGFLAMSPVGFSDDRLDRDVFRLLQMGFTLSLTRNDVTLGYCLGEFLRSAVYVVHAGGVFEALVYIYTLEFGFLACAYECKDILYFVIAIALILALDLLFMVLACRFIFAPMTILVFLSYEQLKILVPVDDIEKFLRNQQPLVPTRYAYNDIITITSHFREKLGQGGFGSVFKGKIPRGRLVAVKMLSNSQCNGEEFINEVSTIGRIHHINVVQLLGFCSEGSKRALVYEYMPNGSLDKYIFSPSNSASHRPFDWDKLLGIALGVARGIDYLHRGCDMRILHFDIKPHNILLDQSFNPKVSDFGLAKLYPKNSSMVSISVARGTIGYIAPELVSRSFGVISHKSDVYSYGMLLLEMAGGRRNVNPRAENTSQVYYPSWIYDQLNQEEGRNIDDTNETGEAERKLLSGINEERKLSKLGLWCIQVKPPDRPSMSRVIEMLEASDDFLPMPPKPFFSSPQPTLVRQSLTNSSLTELAVTSECE